MNRTDTSARSKPESGVETAEGVVGSGREYISKAAPYLRRGVESGAATAIIGGTGLLGGLRALRAGERERGLTILAFGAAFLAAGLAQRRFRSRGGELDIEETDVVDTGPDVEAVADEVGGVGGEDRTAGEAAAEIVDTSPDVTSVETATEETAGVGEEDRVAGEAAAEVADTSPDVTNVETTTAEEDTNAGDGVRTEDIVRLGEAAFDRQSREVPAPQRAFNQGFLSHSAEAFWGIRTRDDAVLVSRDYDAIQGHNGVQYTASSEIGEDVRELPIPNAVLNHWNEVYGGGTAVTGGDGILFVTTDVLSADGLLRVLPAEWADDLSE